MQEGVKIYKVDQSFWEKYHNLPRQLQQCADKSFALLKQNPKHPSLDFKKVGKDLWSARITRDYRVLAREEENTLVWFWVGKHDEYMRLIQANF